MAVLNIALDEVIFPWNDKDEKKLKMNMKMNTAVWQFGNKIPIIMSTSIVQLWPNA